MTDEQDGQEHIPAIEIDLTMAQRSHEQQLAAIELHMAQARPAASVLVTRARLLVRNGVDLRHPERVADFVNDQLTDAVRAAAVNSCGCPEVQGAAAAALLAVVTSELAALLEGRDL